MSNNFPPFSVHESEIQVLIAFLESIIPEHNAVYVSAPITSGRRYIDWIKQHPGNRDFSGCNQNPEFTRNVVEKNREHSRAVVKKLRSSFPGKVLIDPTVVPDLPNWNQDDYRFAWGRIIENYAQIHVCSEDWQFSSGCVYEFLVAKNSKIQTFDEDLKEISLEKGQQLIQEAIVILRSHELSITFHEAVYNELAKRKFAGEGA